MNPSGRRPRRTLIVILALLGSLLGASSALGVSISGADGQDFPSPPSFTITADLGGRLVELDTHRSGRDDESRGAARDESWTPPRLAAAPARTHWLPRSALGVSVGTATRTFQIVDATPPPPPTVAQVPTPTNNRNPIVSWSDAEAGVTFQYQLDGGSAVGTGTNCLRSADEPR